jgi:plasmid stabilization system protein ParE
MAEDIVKSLREQALEGIWDFTKASFDMQVAADEIERLRVKCKHLEAEIARLERLSNG